jgi:hypothetical protein
MSGTWTRDRVFTIEEAAGIIGVPSSTVREWLAKAGNLISAKSGARRFMSATDIFIAAVARHLIATGYATTTAVEIAFSLHGGSSADVATIEHDDIVVARAGGGDVSSAALSKMGALADIADESDAFIILAYQFAAKVLAETNTLRSNSHA